MDANLDTNPSRRYSLATALALLAIAIADRCLAAWLGAEPLLPALSREGAGLTSLLFAVGHCDGMDGPVVKLARKALESGNVNLVLPWVRKQDEAEVRHAFDHARAVRELGLQARSLADHHFFETLVRIHRAGEGAGFTGLKPAGLDVGPAISGADRALEDGSIDSVADLVAHTVRQGIHERFEAAMRRKAFRVDEVEAGREYVAAYVAYIHYVERLWQDAIGEPHGHPAESPAHAHPVHVH